MNTHNFPADIAVAGIKADVFPDGIAAAFDRLKEKFTDWKERTLYGLSWPENGRIVYAACITVKTSEEIREKNCMPLLIKKGDYIIRALSNWEQNTPEISNIFQELIHSRPDLEAPCVEWYRGNDVMCLVRITS